MSNSSLVNYTRISPKSNPRKNATYNPTGKITKITPHIIAGNMTVEQAGEWFIDNDRGASANYSIGTDGRIGLHVPEDRRAWTSSSRTNDYMAVTIEVANDGGAPDWHISDKALESLIKLCVDICKRNGIEKLNFTGDKNGNLTMHKYFAATACPGPYLESKFPYIAQEVNRRLGLDEPEPEPEVPDPRYELSFRTLKYGSKGEDVKALQILLMGNGCSCGKRGADGDFGIATENAVKKYQRKVGLTADGIAGPLTWSSLLGIS